MKYCILILSLLFTTQVKGQTYLFGKKIETDIIAQDVIHIASDKEGSIALLVENEEGFKIIHYDKGEKNTISLTNEVDDASEIYYKRDSLFLIDKTGKASVLNIISDQQFTVQDSKYGSLESFLINDTITTILTEDGLLSNASVYHNKVENTRYYIAENNLYYIDPIVNSYITYHTVNQKGYLSDARLARPLSTGDWVIGLDEKKGTFIKKGNEFINILTQPINSHISDELIFFHVAEAYDRLYFSASDYNIYQLDLNTYRLTNMTSSSGLQYKNLISDDKGDLYCGTLNSEIFHIDSKGKFNEIPIDNGEKPLNTFRHYKDDDGWHWWGYRTGISVHIPEMNAHVGFTKKEGLPTIFDEINAFEIFQDKFYIGSYNSGIHYMDLKKVKNAIIQYINKKTPIPWEDLDIKRLNLGSISDIDEINHLNTIGDYMIIRSADNLYLYNGDEMIKATPNMGCKSNMRNFFSSTTGSTVINSSINGYSLFDPEKFMTHFRKSNLYLSRANKGNKKINFTKKGSRYDLGDFDEKFTYVTLELGSTTLNTKDLRLHYQVNDQEIITVPNNYVVIPNEKIGRNTVTITSEYEPSGISPITITYQVNRKWYNTWWARILFGLVIGGLVYYAIKLWFVKKRLEKNMRLLETESLRSYMNPHFISNSLNSINYYILQNEKDVASSYIIKFSKLIRRVLQNSEKEFVKIKDELDTLSNYIEIEQMRFAGKFEYKIILEDSVNSEDEIPSFILQPIIENAIWHGLVQKGSGGLVTIHFEKHEEYYTIIIKDNGIGYDAASKLKSKSATKRKSFGSKMIKKRLDLLNQIYGYNNKIEINDRYKIDGEKGTIVSLKLNIHQKPSNG